MCVWSVVVAVVLATAGVAGASTIDMGFANGNDGADSPWGYQNYSQTPQFTGLMAGMAANGHAVRYQRFFQAWDGFGAFNSKTRRCEAPTGGTSPSYGSQASLINSVRQAEAAGYTALVVLTGDGENIDGVNGADGNVWQPGAEVPDKASDARYAWPRDDDERCAVQELDRTLTNAGLIAPPGKTIDIEPINEPEGGIPGSSIGPLNSVTHHGSGCDPHRVINGSDCAARYFADAIQGNLEYASGASARIIAGVLKDSSFNSRGVSSGRACAQQSTFLNRYVCFLSRGSADRHRIPDGGLLSSYDKYATNWSMHDYSDTLQGGRRECPSATGPARKCPTTKLREFQLSLSRSHQPLSDVWVTESGYDTLDNDPCANNSELGPPSSACPAREAGSAYDWERLVRHASYVSGVSVHLFWYDFEGLFDSSLTAPRTSYCVLSSQPLANCPAPQ